MSKKFSSVLAMVLVIALVAPAAFLVVPQRVSAADSTIQCAGGLAGAGLGAIASVFGLEVPTGNVAVLGATGATAGSTIGNCLYTTIVQPLLRSLIHNILMAVTSSIINWINGGNGTGQPSFVQDLSRHLQAVGDAVALPFVNQVRSALNPAFAAAIASSLLTRYALGTSVGGFLAQNQSTLSLVSPNPSAFIAGNFSQGGIPALFALTTKDENNPYIIAPAAQNQLNSLVAQAQTNRRQDLVQSKGFLSFCGPGSTSSGANGINPGTSCIDSVTGAATKVQTPGSVIQGYTDKVLGSEIAQLINPTDINSALVAILQASINQGIKGITTGLFSSSQSSSARPTTITAAMSTTATTNSAAITAANTAAAAAISQSTDYSTAWNTISSAASGASVNVTALKNNAACASQSANANTALGAITQVTAQATQAASDASAKQTLARKIQSEAASGTSAALTTDMRTLSTMAPVAADIAVAQADAATTGGASASPAGSLSVADGTLVDQMNLISTNAMTLNSNNCPAP